VRLDGTEQGEIELKHNCVAKQQPKKKKSGDPKNKGKRKEK